MLEAILAASPNNKKQFEITASAYSVTLIVVSNSILNFHHLLFHRSFNPYFISEYRTPALICTVLGFINGINPFHKEYVDGMAMGTPSFGLE
jgi:hypothetical protein